LDIITILELLEHSYTLQDIPASLYLYSRILYRIVRRLVMCNAEDSEGQ